MSIVLSKRVQRVSLSANAAAKSQATALREGGADILDLTTGEPDFDTPQHIKNAAFEAIDRGDTKYTPTPGGRALREAVQRKLRRENHLDYSLASVVIANGAKQIIFNAFAATLNDGDEVLIPVPYWPSFPDSVRFNGGEPVFIECGLEQGCKLTPEQLEQHINERTRWLILNGPGNPSGAVYDREELLALAHVLRRHPNVLILLDELYEHIRFDGQAALSLLNVAADLQSRCLLVGGVSKTYAMTGWRIGFGAGPQDLTSAMTVVQSQSTSGVSSVGQAAALGQVAGLEVLVPQGGFFVFVRCAGLLGRYRPDGQRVNSDADVVAWLLESGVAGVAGSAYGLSPWFRLSIATATDTVREAGRRIARACAQLHSGETT
ncbi:aminotransferase class I/II-fold pyridoxal phosphate-dependent enzyme [Pseudomonas ficuserectae]|uniref:aminotransferase class I/II-fold pyridoxal phosphate-dependent enzyme n=1 Tax=Pseudomonas ficuserectae TaxID=53410 RepID=UPI00211C15FC|nr:aminotransferase class I/II-fold pyridoxal phosphate-dependent enzyme [Pseudomonas ficuserectae]